jgi:hypothetical protein
MRTFAAFSGRLAASSRMFSCLSSVLFGFRFLIQPLGGSRRRLLPVSGVLHYVSIYYIDEVFAAVNAEGRVRYHDTQPYERLQTFPYFLDNFDFAIRRILFGHLTIFDHSRSGASVGAVRISRSYH